MSKSRSGTCEKPRATRRALNRSIVWSEFSLILKTHLMSMVLRSGGKVHRPKVPDLRREVSSLWIAWIHWFLWGLL